MSRSVFLVSIIVTLYFKSYFCTICENKTESSGAISFPLLDQYGYYNQYSNGNQYSCWTIKLPPQSVLILKFERLEFPSQYCSTSYVKITELGVTGASKESTFCKTKETLPVTVAFHDVRVDVFTGGASSRNFKLVYYTESSTCYDEDIFYCSNKFCIPSHKVCDGIKDCQNGLDEKSCKTGIFSVEGFDVSRDKTSTWLEKNLTAGLGWEKNLHRGIVALYLSGKINCFRDLPQHVLLVKQLEIETTMALLRNSTEPVSINELSMIVNALLVVCHNPRYFYGFNLVQILREAVKNSEDLVNPVAYLTLCNAHEPLPPDAIAQLIHILENATDTEYLFLSEIKAIAVMTLSCVLKNGQKSALNETDLEIYNDTVKQFKQLQCNDGSFGNVYTTALIVQALFSKGEETATDWNLRNAVKYLMKELNSEDFLSTYMILPVLNRKSLADITDANCTGHAEYNNGNAVSEIAFSREPKMRIQYSLYLGKNIDVIHTIYLTVPKSTSAYGVMEVAALADPKYKFQSKSMSGKIYVFDIKGYINDPEAGLFWLTYLTGPRFNDTLVHYKSSPDEIKVQEHDHLIMWYRSARL